MEKIIEILNNIKPGVDFTVENNLFEDHIIASLEIMMLVSELDDAFDIRITLPDIKPENFKSAQTIYEMVERIIDED